MDERVIELCSGFESFVRVFVDSERFTGPSWYFHRKALRKRAEHHAMSSVLEDEVFFDLLYATLTAWGLHRMGPGNAKLRNIDDFREGIRQVSGRIDELSIIDITEVSETQIEAIADKVWDVLTRLRVSVAAAQIVANTKALHHLLPALVPPMDREYTFRFFYGRNMLSVDEQTAFLEMFTRLLRVAAAQKSAIRRLVDTTWNTSHAKILDNAVVGYMIARESTPPRNSTLRPSGPLAD